MDKDGDLAYLTLRHGCKILLDPAVSVEDCLLAVGGEIPAACIKSASRMNKSVVVFFSDTIYADNLVETGLVVNDVFYPVLPLSNPSKKVVISNVPPFIKNEMLENVLARHGKFTAPIKMIPLGCKNPDMKHIMSFRRQTFMILNNQSEALNLSVKLKLEGKEYIIFISSDTMRCFDCGEQGHVRQNCPRKKVSPPADQGVNNVDSGEGGAAGEHAPPQGGEIAKDKSPTGPNVQEHSTQEDPIVTDKQNTVDSHNGAAATENIVNNTANTDESGVVADSMVRTESDRPTVAEEQSAQISDEAESDYDDMEEEEDGDDEVPALGRTRRAKLYTLEAINLFLDSTKNGKGVQVRDFFPDEGLFLQSCAEAIKKASFQELDQQKRWRLNKFTGAIKRSLKAKKGRGRKYK